MPFDLKRRMAQILSQDEVDALLQGLDNDEIEAEGSSPQPERVEQAYTLESAEEEESVDLSRNGKKADAAVVSAFLDVGLLEDGDNGRVFPVLGRPFSLPDDGDELVEPDDDGLASVFEHFGSDEAYARRFTVLQPLDDVGDFF